MAEGKNHTSTSCGVNRYKGIEEPLVRDQDVPLLKKGARGRSAVERELGKEGIAKDCGTW